MNNKIAYTRILLLSAVLIFFAAGCAPNAIVRVSDMKEVELPEVLKNAKNAPLILVGEVHSEKSHHENQLAVIRALKESSVPVAIGMEMFQAKDQQELNRWVAGKMSEDDFIKVYYTNWHIPWKEYRDIMVYARDNNIPVIGLNISQSVMHQVFNNGYKSLTPEQLQEIPGIRCEVDKTYENFIRRAMEEHDLKNASFTDFCEAQLVWDTIMARRSVKYLNDNPGKKLVVLAGSGHSWKRGIPEQVRKISDIKYLVMLPEIPGRVDRNNVSTEDADYLILDP